MDALSRPFPSDRQARSRGATFATSAAERPSRQDPSVASHRPPVPITGHVPYVTQHQRAPTQSSIQRTYSSYRASPYLPDTGNSREPGDEPVPRPRPQTRVPVQHLQERPNHVPAVFQHLAPQQPVHRPTRTQTPHRSASRRHASNVTRRPIKSALKDPDRNRTAASQHPVHPPARKQAPQIRRRAPSAVRSQIGSALEDPDRNHTALKQPVHRPDRRARLNRTLRHSYNPHPVASGRNRSRTSNATRKPNKSALKEPDRGRNRTIVWPSLLERFLDGPGSRRRNNTLPNTQSADSGRSPSKLRKILSFLSHIWGSSSSSDTIVPINRENPQLLPYPSSTALQSNGSVYNTSFMTSPSYGSLVEVLDDIAEVCLGMIVRSNCTKRAQKIDHEHPLSEDITNVTYDYCPFSY